MNILDIIVGALLLYALWRGWSSGILVQLSGIAGIVLGAWLAYRFSEQVSLRLDVPMQYNSLVFVAILIVVMIGIILLGKLLTKVLSYGGLSAPIKLLGAAASILKIIIILSLVLRTFESLNDNGKIVDTTYLQKSIAYKPLTNIASTIFPYIANFADKIDKDNPQIREHIEEQVQEQVKKEIDKHKDSIINNIKTNE